MIGIYKITSPSGRIYIGQSINIKERIQYHKRTLSKTQPRLYNSFVKYGVDAHKFEVVELCEKENLNEREKYYIKLFNCFNNENGLNLMSGGLLSYPSDLSREKMRLAKLGKKRTPMSEETKKKIGDANKGKIRSNEQKLEMSLLRKGKPSGSKGIKWDLESRRAWSETMTGVKRGVYKIRPEPRKNKGVQLSDEHKSKLSAIKKGKKLSETHVKNISNSNKGKKRSDETRARIKESWVRRKNGN